MRTDTNSSLATARDCLRKYELRYQLRLSRAGEESEALAVGTCWHDAHDERASGRDPHAFLRRHAPSPLWAEKLSRLFAAYHWRWADDGLVIEKSEHVVRGERVLGKADVVARCSDGRRVLVERKTTSDSVEDDSSYWDRLRLDAQVGIYALLLEDAPDLILYDVVRKPTINPKKLSKADLETIRGGWYFNEEVSTADAAEAAATGRETVALYGARLTADVGARPDHYFGRRLVHRTKNDFDALVQDVRGQLAVLDFCEERGTWPRNPNACATFGLCEFFSLCSIGAHPSGSSVPDGYVVREHRHPELAALDGAASTQETENEPR